jgi:hypothetical protein
LGKNRGYNKLSKSYTSNSKFIGKIYQKTGEQKKSAILRPIRSNDEITYEDLKNGQSRY